MNWKRKALLQNTLAKLPSEFSYWLYEKIQRKFGAYRHGIDPFGRLEIAATFVENLERQGFDITGKTVLEVGSGRTLLVPLGLWLCGAKKIKSVDLHPYLSETMTANDFGRIQAEPERLRKMFQDVADQESFEERFKAMMEVDYKALGARKTLAALGVEYCAPGDAADLDLEDDIIDLHTSVAVLEHIPAEILKSIFKEGVRVTKPAGWFVHRWDMSDHFSHKDHSITATNFVQFDESEWGKYNDNRYMYVNRLRVDFFDQFFSDFSLEVKERITSVDERAHNALESGELKPVEPFKSKSNEVIATTAATFYAVNQG